MSYILKIYGLKSRGCVWEGVEFRVRRDRYVKRVGVLPV